MTAEEATVANHDLWCAYLRSRWQWWLDPLGLPAEVSDQLIQAAAAPLAQWLTVVGHQAIALLFRSNLAGWPTAHELAQTDRRDSADPGR